ncbi:MAG: molybdate ABC transporter substrate-binding protein [Cyanosarcina radialis HA8281-LM2]|jgi:molybdate transport system substrate-binding protein|nr:molybdate ABC transporter substrate-binding protein [Cyanosarcina radialis HA8281-LM2]
MKRKRFITFISLAIATAIALIIGNTLLDRSQVANQSNHKLLVSAAISLKESLKEVDRLYQQEQPTTKNTYNFGASGALQQQIENGAPVDIFISAGKKQMDALEQKGLLVPDTRRNLTTNSMVLIVLNNITGVSSFEDLTSDRLKRIAIGEPRSVPAGQYAQEIFNNLGIWQQVRPKLVFSNNVRQVLVAVESGNADAGLVYTSDARTSEKVKVIATAADNLHSPIVYPIAVLKSSKNVAAAKNYLLFAIGSEARAVWQKYGFGNA